MGGPLHEKGSQEELRGITLPKYRYSNTDGRRPRSLIGVDDPALVEIGFSLGDTVPHRETWVSHW